MALNSKNKGKNGELELSHKLKEYGFNTHRTAQFCGKGGESADVVGLPYIHIEAKRVEHLNIDDALTQAIRDSKPENIPAVFHRKNRSDWKVTLRLDDFMRIYGEYYSSMVLAERGKEGNE